jgi:NADPH:quinone reductase-like Zn-dependent oxidoreductase
MGADVAIDYTRTRFEDVAKDVDVVLDTVGRDTFERSYGVVKRGESLCRSSTSRNPRRSKRMASAA